MDKHYHFVFVFYKEKLPGGVLAESTQVDIVAEDTKKALEKAKEMLKPLGIDKQDYMLKNIIEHHGHEEDQ